MTNLRRLTLKCLFLCLGKLKQEKLDDLFGTIILRIYAVFEALIRCINYPLYLLQELRTKKKYLPPIKDNEILCKSATYLAKKIRSGELKSENVVKAYIKRIKEVNPYLNAVVEDRFNDAINEAKAVDKLIASKIKTLKQMEIETPFLGVPMTIKESCKVKGMSFCVGSLIRKGIKANEDGKTVKNLRNSGAVILAVTTTPEFCCSCETDNLVTGKTLNPYNQLRTPGGSSGGEAALISSGASVCGIGSDIGGSIRIPSFFTGIFGHKPTPGYVSTGDHFPEIQEFEKFLVIGPMCRYSEDLLPILKVMVGNKASELRLDEKINLKNLKVLYALESHSKILGLPVDKEIKEAITKAASYLERNYGSTVIATNIKELEKSMEICLCTAFSSGTPGLFTYPDNPKKSYNVFMEILKAFFGWSHFSLPAMFVPILNTFGSKIPKTVNNKYVKLGEVLQEKFESEIDGLGTNGVFLYPIFPTLANYHGEFFGKMSGLQYSMIFNIMGMPSTHVPMGISSSGLPVGFQVVAAPHQDRLCFAVANALEQGFGGWVPPPSSSL